MDTSYKQLVCRLQSKLGWAAPTSGVFINATCPVCGKKKLSVNARTGTFKCWRGCITNGKLSELLGGHFKVTDLAKREQDAQSPEDCRFIPPGAVVPFSEVPTTHPAYQYVLDRGFDPLALSTDYLAGVCTEGQYFAKGRFHTTNTVVFPIIMDGEAVAWQARLPYDPDAVPEAECRSLGMLNDETGKLVRFIKYFTMPGFRKGTLFFNFQNAMQSDFVVITEGVFDALAVGRCAVASLGKEITDTQVSAIAATWKLAVVLLDPDAQKEGLKLVSRLQLAGCPAFFVLLKGKKDAGEFSRDRVALWTQILDAGRTNGIDLDQMTCVI